MTQNAEEGPHSYSIAFNVSFAILIKFKHFARTHTLKTEVYAFTILLNKSYLNFKTNGIPLSSVSGHTSFGKTLPNFELKWQNLSLLLIFKSKKTKKRQKDNNRKNRQQNFGQLKSFLYRSSAPIHVNFTQNGSCTNV